MPKTLILLTRRFPYFKTEAFLESEIKILAQYFDEIIIYPSEISSEIREVPNNVKIENDFSKKYQNKKQRLLRTLFSGTFWNALAIHKSQIKSLSDVLILFRFASGADAYLNFFDKKKAILEDNMVYSYWFNAAPFAFIKLKEKWGRALNIISRAHRYDIYENLPSTQKFWPFRKEILSKIDRVYSISEDGKRFIEEKYGHADKIEVSKLGVHDRGKLSYRSTKNRISIVSVSRINPMKRVELILESVTRLAEMLPDHNIFWTHFGDGDSLYELQNKSIDLKNLTIHFPGAVKNSFIYDNYAQNPVDLFINLSASEGIPVSIMEAQSFGIPVVATNVGGSGEIVNKDNGFLLPANPTADEAADAIKITLQKSIDPEVIKKQWNQNFNAEINYKAFAENLQSINNFKS
jgi:glycosyltransferase involved in cell wall biosynthesis